MSAPGGSKPQSPVATPSTSPGAHLKLGNHKDPQDEALPAVIYVASVLIVGMIVEMCAI